MAPLECDLVRGNLDLVILSVLLEGPAYGYLIQQRLRESSRGMVAVQAGTLYPLLHNLEAKGLLRSRWDGAGRRRKWYSLTAAGRRSLKREARAWSEQVDCLRRILAPVLSHGAPEPA
jgi:DNA-binding PadR family transcriptional regulator